MEKFLTSTKTWIAIGFFIYVGLFFFRMTNLAASDLGRHISNGRIIVETGRVFNTNLYSYTNPDFPAPNHHWLFGVISYLVYQGSGFAGLTWMGAFLYIAGIAVVFFYTWKTSSLYSTLVATTVVLPLFTARVETRPEAFSLFFFSIVFCAFGWISTHRNLHPIWPLTVGLGILLAVWVNIHIFFILSALVGIAAFLHAVINKNSALIKQLLYIAGALVAGVFINPLGWKLVIYPLHIFGNYGYRVAENQSLWFFLNHYTQPLHWYLALCMIVFVISTIVYTKNNFKNSFFFLFNSIFFLVFTFKLIRMENIFAVTAIPLISYQLTEYWKKNHQKVRTLFKNSVTTMVVSIFGFSALCMAVGSGLFFPFQADFGIGLYPGYDQTIAFVKNLPNTGPIFNNFDDGSFLIFALYPQQKVFVDNRAEAYPADFLQNQYLKAQNDESAWQQLENRYHFSTIIFYRQENTNWGQDFLVKRIQDSSWIPIYVDPYLIIFAKDTPANQAIIQQYRLPASMFSIQKN